jgi:predicted small lipoprotein YifL
MSKSQPIFFSLKLMFATLLLFGCGIRGELYLPEEEASSESQVLSKESKPVQEDKKAKPAQQAIELDSTKKIEPKEYVTPAKKEENVS